MNDVNILVNNGFNIDGSLELFGDMETYNETIKDFMSTIDVKLGEIKAYKEVADLTNYSILVHSLKSDSKYLGFTRLAELSYQHEMESKANNMVFVYDHYDELIEEASRVLKVVKEYMGEAVPAVEIIKPVIIKDKKILVVDDSNIVRNLIKKIFDDEFEVLTAEDGREAINLVNANPELYGVLLDLNMPNVNGFAVLDYFKGNNLFARIPVAIITGDDTKETTDRAFTYTIVDVLNKPFNERDVKRVVTAMINFH